MSRRLLAAALLLAAAGCGQGELRLDLAPRFAALLEVPGLLGVVIVTRADGGEEVARAGLVAFEGSAATRLGGIPAGVDLLVRVEWYSGLVVVAQSREPMPVRLDEGKTSSVAFDADALDYPDDDGDGAANLAEVVWASVQPTEGAEAWSRADRLPPGFLTGFVAAVPTPGHGFSAAPFGSMALHAVPLVDLVLQGGTSVPVNPRLEVFEPSSRNHQEHVLGCNASGYPLTARVSPAADPPEVAVLCGATLSFVQPEENLGLSTSAEVVLGVEAPRMAYARDGSRVYVPHKERGTLSVVGATPFAPEHGQVLRVLAPPELPEGGVLMDVADTGTRLLVSDAGGGGLLVLERLAGQAERFVARILVDALDTPGLLLVHPRGQVAYVATSDPQAGRYLLVAVDISAADPATWQTIGSLALDGPAVGLAIDPSLGAYLYVATTQSVFGIEAFSFRAFWSRQASQQSRGLIYDLALTGDGRSGLALQADAMGILLLGNPDAADGQEAEPNGTLPATPQAANTLRVDGDASVGFVDMADPEAGPLTEINCHRHDPAGPVDFAEDLEDVWRLDRGAATGPVAVAVLQTTCRAELSLAALDASGAPVQTAYSLAGNTCQPLGSGVFLVVPAVEAVAGVGLGAIDVRHTTNFTSYEVLAVSTGAFTDIDEDEQGDPDFVQAIVSAPVRVHGRAEVGDAGGIQIYPGDLVEDCYSLNLSDGHKAVRLDFAEDADLDLFALDAATGLAIKDAFAIVSYGTTEYFIAEPNSIRPRTAKLCVGIDDNTLPAQADYTLTIVDLAH